MPLKTNKYKYLEIEDLLLIHSALIDEIGGSHGVRDMTRLDAACGHPKQKVFGKELFETLFEKAASYSFDIINFHPFVDGNKRTGMASMAVFLELNAWQLETKKGLVERMAVDSATKKLSDKEIAAWLKTNSTAL
jgi:death-on-curing protein